jgi:septum formation protein
MNLILGSNSPRRYEILSYFNIPFQQSSPDFDESSIPFKGDPIEHVKKLSKGKADSLVLLYPHSIILTADTIVYSNDKVYGKPSNEQEALQFLTELEGKWHCVYTGLTVRIQEKEYQEMEETKVLFNPLTQDQMAKYHQLLPFVDKAGGYMIQGAGSLIVNRIEGCYYNVVGLPINALCRILKCAGIDLWNHLKGV